MRDGRRLFQAPPWSKPSTKQYLLHRPDFCRYKVLGFCGRPLWDHRKSWPGWIRPSGRSSLTDRELLSSLIYPVSFSPQNLAIVEEVLKRIHSHGTEGVRADKAGEF